ncbi:MAG: NAD(P)/FAD-dependent oxidoreductase [Cyanobacteria bacterium J06592_8]
MTREQTKSSLLGNSISNVDYDIAIIGAGPVGLATALGLYQRGIENVIVLDQTRAFRQVGQTVDLLPNGLKSLKYTHTQAYENITATVEKANTETPSEKKQPSSEWTTRNVNGQKIRSFPLGYDDWFNKYGEGRVSIAWFNLQTQLRTLLPSDRVKINHRCVNVVNEPDFNCIRANFSHDLRIKENPYSHWQEAPEEEQDSTLSPDYFDSETTSIRAKLLIAADGINSTVRQVVYKDTPYYLYDKPKYSGLTSISGGLNCIPETLSQKINDRFLQGNRVVTIVGDKVPGNSSDNQGGRMLLYSPKPGYFGYLAYAPLPLELLTGKSGQDLIDIAVSELKKANFPEIIQQLVAESDPLQMRQRPYYIHRVTVPPSDTLKWSRGRVVLVGDAAHGMPPFAAQGANQGLEDAAVISALVAEIARKNQWDDLSAIASAFNQYESLRRPLLSLVQQTTLTGLDRLSESELEEYNQQVYARNIDKIINELLL